MGGIQTLEGARQKRYVIVVNNPDSLHEGRWIVENRNGAREVIARVVGYYPVTRLEDAKTAARADGNRVYVCGGLVDVAEYVETPLTGDRHLVQQEGSKYVVKAGDDRIGATAIYVIAPLEGKDIGVEPDQCNYQ